MSYDERKSTIIRERAMIMANADGDIEWQNILREKCRRDPIFFIENFLFTFDPRLERTPHHHAFVLYDFQIEFVKWLEGIYQNQTDGLIEKSRDMGATWLIMAWALWHWLFDDNFQFLAGSRKEDYVDKTDSSSSLFYKIDYMLKRLPRWLLPLGFSLESKKYRTHLQLINPRNHNTIAGEATNPDFGRGGRFSAILFDEFAFWDFARTAWSSAGDSSPVRIPLSTPSESGTGFFKDLRFSGKLPVKTLHWSSHPLKTQEWYEAEKERRSVEEIAVNLDISYEPSGRGRVYPEFDFSIKDTFIERDGRMPLYISWDYGVSDDCAIIWLQKDPITQRVQVIDAYNNNNKDIGFYVSLVTGRLDEKYDYSDEERQMIERHKTWQGAQHFGDPAGKQRSQVTNTSVIDELKKHGIHVRTNDKATRFPPRREATKRLLRRLEVSKQLNMFIDSITNAHYPQRNENSQATNPVVKPVHDWTSHFRTALEYFAVNEKTRKQRGRIHTIGKKDTNEMEGLSQKVWDDHELLKSRKRRRPISMLGNRPKKEEDW